MIFSGYKESWKGGQKQNRTKTPSLAYFTLSEFQLSLLHEIQ